MPRDRLTFRQRDVTAAIKVAERSTGREVTRVTIGQDGSIIVELAPSVVSGTAPALDLNEWDEDPLYGKK
jgi:hypothetical protein